MKSNYKICNKCIMDTSDPDIHFKDGVCSHCFEYQKNLKTRIVQGKEGKEKLNSIINKIKKKSKNKKYNCIIGVSGGVDSTYVAYKCKELELNPLAVHFDNGWDSELAISNIEKVLKKLNIDLYTYVVDWEEFKELQLSFLYASTPDSEIPTDHAIYAILMKIAAKKNIKTIISGMNYRTESIMPKSWAYGHADWKYIKNIQKKFGKKNLKSFPHYSLSYLFYIKYIKKIQFISILNYIDYNKEEALKTLEKKLGWKDYGGKHCESIYTRFFQGYILPKKFNIDKRRAHLSNLINSGQIKREKALEEIKKTPYSMAQMNEDKNYVIKKFELTEKKFEKIMNEKPKTFMDYKNNYKLIMKIKKYVYNLRSKGLFPK